MTDSVNSVDTGRVDSPHNETIVAIITPPGEGGIAAIRLAGPKSHSLLTLSVRSTDNKSISFEPMHMQFGRYYSINGEMLDEVMAVCMTRGHSYTGADQAEIFCHGGQQIVKLILEDIIACGARPALPGEFTKLAFLSGRIDLAKAEAVAEIISANSHHSYTVSREHLLGAYSEHITSLRERLLGLLAEIETAIDFTENENYSAPYHTLTEIATKVEKNLSKLILTYTGGKIISEGFTVAVAGRPNAGKSSLFNRLLQQDRAIVNPQAGTTRDYLSEWIILNGFSINLVDTAGLRKEGGEIEKSGQQRAKQIIDKADLVLWLFDLSDTTAIVDLQTDINALSGHQLLAVGNKHDLVKNKNIHEVTKSNDGLLISCLTGEGIEELKTALLACIEQKMPDLTSGLVVTSARHRHKLALAQDSLASAMVKLTAGASPELIAFDLRESINSLDEIIGKVYTEDILGEIFSRFCIGK
ncbi:MAG: tRNA uridine-5-carboxymethylaminomethyl(34) synthesis GTPase MnmE [candidate division Zixibacteria bacterium]|nr:tRNA uridine-5-carboxymethylaminomethyl(34) synthesis GTPase MnmE [candidate division Zixibacteria bacterium]